MAGWMDVFLAGSVPEDGAFAGSLILRDKSRKWRCSHRHPAHADAQFCAELAAARRDGSEPMPEGWDRTWVRDWSVPGGKAWKPDPDSSEGQAR